MKKPKPARKSKKPMQVTLGVPARSYEAFAKADKEIRRQCGESPGVESLMSAALESERDVEQLVHAYHCRMMAKSRHGATSGSGKCGSESVTVRSPT